MSDNCPCGSNKLFLQCCGLYIENNGVAKSPEALMRSRYAAYSRANMDYIKKTMRDEALSGFDEQEAQRWAESVNWVQLQIINTFPELRTKERGFVEFIASFVENGEPKSIHERSEFQRHEGKWYYTRGHSPTKEKSKTNISRNAPCPCGSLSKYKNCHGRD